MEEIKNIITDEAASATGIKLSSQLPTARFVIVYPAVGEPYIEFTWRVGENPKRYKLEVMVENLAKLGVLEEIHI